MPQKYPLPRIITNDLYLAAFLLCQGSTLSGVLCNERRRLSFVFSGSRVHELRTEYESGIVRLNVRSYKDHLLAVRRTMDAEQRRAQCQSPPSVELSPMQLSRA
jgi:hypothetical protein